MENAERAMGFTSHFGNGSLGCLWSPVLLLIRITIKNHRLVVPRVVGHRAEAA